MDRRRRGAPEKRSSLSRSGTTKAPTGLSFSTELSFQPLRPSETGLSESLQQWRSSLETEAFEICQFKLKDKIQSISEKWKVISSLQEPPAPDRYDAGIVYCHPTNMMLINALKQEVLDLNKMVDSLQLFLTLQFPKSMSAMPFHATVQKQIIGELKVASLGCGLIIRVLNTYIESRAYVISEVLEQPHIEDYKRALDEYDNTHSVNIRRWLYDLEITYTVLEDTILKNFDRIFRSGQDDKTPVFR